MFVWVLLAMAAWSPNSGRTAAAPEAAHSAAFQFPLAFEPNHGQAAAGTAFLARGRGGNFFLDACGVGIALVWHDQTIGDPRHGYEPASTSTPAEIRLLRFEFVHANPQAEARGLGLLPGRVNYLLGNDPACWHTDVPTFQRVQFTGLYPGVDVVYYANARRLEYDFVIAAGADPGAIMLRLKGADRVQVAGNGDLVLELGHGSLRQHAPLAYQVINGHRVEVASRYQLGDEATVCFDLGDYDRTRPLVIDPILSYSTYLGGIGADEAWTLTVDSEGHAYVGGVMRSAGLATPGAFDTNYAGSITTGGDAFIAKLNPGGLSLAYLTYLGGDADDGVLDLAVDEAGRVFAAGYTTSTNFPTVSAFQSGIASAPSPTFGIFLPDAFVVRLNETGSTLEYSTYLGGRETDVGIAIGVDTNGSAVVTGYTISSNFPTQNALQPHHGGFDDVFVTRLSPAGNTLVYSTFLGGTNTDRGEGLALDPQGFTYISGYTSSTNFPTVAALQTNRAGGRDAFVTKLTPAGDAFVYSTYLGGTLDDLGARIIADADGNAYLTGSTISTNFPVTNTNFPNVSTNVVLFANAFLSKLTPDGAALGYSISFGGGGRDEGFDLALGAQGSPVVVGYTDSHDFPIASTNTALQATNAGFKDAFVAVFNPTATALNYSTYFGGPFDDLAYGVGLDPAGNIYFSGRTLSDSGIATFLSFQNTFGGVSDGFITKLTVEPTLELATQGSNAVLRWPAFSIGFELQVTSPLGSLWTNVGQPPVISNGFHTITLPADSEQQYYRLRRP